MSPHVQWTTDRSTRRSDSHEACIYWHLRLGGTP